MPRQIIWCRAPGASTRAFLGIAPSVAYNQREEKHKIMTVPSGLITHVNEICLFILNHFWYTYRMNSDIRLQVVFYRTELGVEPVRDWLQGLSKIDKKIIGEDLKTVQFGWPLGMPLVRKLEPGLWEIRIHLDNRIARILFTVQNGLMVLLHGFIKKSQKIPASELKVGRQRMATLGD